MKIRLFLPALILILAMALPFASLRAQDAPALTGSEWQLVSLDGAPVLESTTVTLAFADDGSAGGSAGCNSWGASVTVEGSTITFGMPFSTRKMCAQEGVMEQEQAFLAALQAATAYSREGSTLTITYGTGAQLVFSAISPLTGTNWALVSLGAAEAPTPLLQDTIVTLMLGDDGSAAGSAGCNRYRSSYSVDGSSISFGPIVSTMMACEPAVMEQEAAFAQALEAASSFSLVDGQLSIAYGDGEQLVLRPLSVLAGSEWTLSAWNAGGQDIALVDGSRITLGFGYDDDAYGFASCNRYRSSVVVEDSAITFGAAATTRMMCEQPLADQEAAWLSTLQAAVSFVLRGDQLTLIASDGSTLTFTPGSAS